MIAERPIDALIFLSEFVVYARYKGQKQQRIKKNGTKTMRCHEGYFKCLSFVFIILHYNKQAPYTNWIINNMIFPLQDSAS